MKFSEHWLRTLVNPPLDTAALCDKLTMAGLEVEDAAPAAPPFSGVVVARIDAVAAHPNADRLRVCTVDAGTGAPLQIVCGAPNAAAGHEGPLRARRRRTARAGSRSARRRCAASSRTACSARPRNSASTTMRRACCACPTTRSSAPTCAPRCGSTTR